MDSTRHRRAMAVVLSLSAFLGGCGRDADKPSAAPKPVKAHASMAESYSTIGELTAAVKLVARIRGTSNVTHLLIEGDHWTTLRTVEVLEVMKGDQALVGTTFEAIQDGRADMPNTMAEEDFPFIEAGSEYVIFGNGGPSKTEPTRLHFGPWGLFKVSGSSLTDLDPLSQLPAAQQTLQIPELRAAVAGGH